MLRSKIVTVDTPTTNFPTRLINSCPQQMAASLNRQPKRNFDIIPETARYKTPNAMIRLPMFVNQLETWPSITGHPCSSR